MKVCAKPVEGKKGMVELYADGKKVDGVHCRPGSARISNGMIEFMAYVRVAPYSKIEASTAVAVKEVKGENNNK